jgi:hypothetical protein
MKQWRHAACAAELPVRGLYMKPLWVVISLLSIVLSGIGVAAFVFTPLPQTQLLSPETSSSVSNINYGTPASSDGLQKQEVSSPFVMNDTTVEMGPYTGAVSADIALIPNNQTELNSTIDFLYASGSAFQGEYMSTAQFATLFGNPQYSTVVQYFRSMGIAVETSSNHIFLSLSGAASVMAAVFGTSFNVYQSPTGLFYEHPSIATLPSWIPISGLTGLSSLPEAVPLSNVVENDITPASIPTACSGLSDVWPASVPVCAMQSSYNETGLLSAHNNGTGQTIGIIDASGWNNASAITTNLHEFDANFSLPNPTLNVKKASDTTPYDPAAWDEEMSLDVEWSHAMAPGATINLTLSLDDGPTLFTAVNNVIANDSANVISLSWGIPDVGQIVGQNCVYACNASYGGVYQLLNPVFQEAAVEGITIFASSGDCGSYDGTGGLSTSFPASSEWVTGVGGTQLLVNPTGTLSYEAAWSGNPTGVCANTGGSGGGFSPLQRPWWQTGKGIPSSPMLRGVPDVAADGYEPVYEWYSTLNSQTDLVIPGQTQEVYGTSLASPLWAGMTATMNQDRGKELGFLNPSIYAILKGSDYLINWTATNKTTTAFHDVLNGTNGYNAGYGWSPVTGVGTPNLGQLVKVINNFTVTPATISTLTITPRAVYSQGFVSWHITTTGNNSALKQWAVGYGAVQYGIAPFWMAFNNVSFEATISTTDGGNISYPDFQGVFPIQGLVIDANGNVSVTPPIAVLEGNQTSPEVFNAVTLSPSTTTPSVNAPVTFTTTLTPSNLKNVSYEYFFGDGHTQIVTGPNFNPNSYLGTTDIVSHAYKTKGAYCVTVIVDESTPEKNNESVSFGVITGGGSSDAIGIGVGGVSAPTCSTTGTGQPEYTIVGPSQPTHLTATVVTTTTIKVTWTNPSGTLTKDKILIGRSCSETAVIDTSNDPITTYTFTGLMINTPYCVQISTNTSYAESPVVSLTTITESTTPPTPTVLDETTSACTPREGQFSPAQPGYTNDGVSKNLTVIKGDLIYIVTFGQSGDSSPYALTRTVVDSLHDSYTELHNELVAPSEQTLPFPQNDFETDYIATVKTNGTDTITVYDNGTEGAQNVFWAFDLHGAEYDAAASNGEAQLNDEQYVSLTARDTVPSNALVLTSVAIYFGNHPATYSAASGVLFGPNADCISRGYFMLNGVINTTTNGATPFQTVSWADEQITPYTTVAAIMAIFVANVPAAPTALTPEAPGATSETLTWTNPANSALVNNTLYVASGSCSGTFVGQTTAGAKTTFTVTGLTSGVAYCFYVTAWNVTGQSMASSPTTVLIGSSGGGFILSSTDILYIIMGILLVVIVVVAIYYLTRKKRRRYYI